MAQQNLHPYQGDVKTYQSNVLKDERFKQNQIAMFALAKELDTRLHMALKQGHEKAISKHIAAGKLLPRDRVELLLDEDSPWLELCPLAGWGQKDVEVGASTIGGIGLVRYFVFCMIFRLFMSLNLLTQLYHHCFHHGVPYAEYFIIYYIFLVEFYFNFYFEWYFMFGYCECFNNKRRISEQNDFIEKL
jgi:hypothetical protein